jgi:hypothetical protein
MLYAAFGVFVLIAAVLNSEDKKTLALCLVVSAGFFSPLPKNDWLMFYVCGICTELCVALLAWRLNCAASKPIVVVSFSMALCHAAGIIYDGYPPLSPYRILVPAFELAEPIFIILTSRWVSSLLHNHESPSV